MSNLSGFILINKPKDITSFQVIRYLKKFLPKNTKIGHAGTLDPFATGLVIIAISREYTKKISMFLNSDKEYIATAQLGILTDTLDLTGSIIKECDHAITQDSIQNSIEELKDNYVQIPPIYSALKYQGKALYKLARNKKLSEQDLNKISQNKKREVKIYSIDILEFNDPYLKIKTQVSHGTYIRSLVNDIAQMAGTVATTQELMRTKIDNYSLDQALELEKIKDAEMIEKNLLKI